MQAVLPGTQGGLAATLAKWCKYAINVDRDVQAVMPGEEGDLAEYMKPVTVMNDKGVLCSSNCI